MTLYRYINPTPMDSCERCAEHDGKIYTLKEITEGGFMPPLHPNCDCYLEPLDADEEQAVLTGSTSEGQVVASSDATQRLFAGRILKPSVLQDETPPFLPSSFKGSKLKHSAQPSPKVSKPNPSAPPSPQPRPEHPLTPSHRYKSNTKEELDALRKKEAKRKQTLDAIRRELNGLWVGGTDGAKVALDVLGMIPAVGEPADLLSALVSSARGDTEQAALSLVAAIPFFGWTSGEAKLVKDAGVLRRWFNDAKKIFTKAKPGKQVANTEKILFIAENKQLALSSIPKDLPQEVQANFKRLFKNGSNAYTDFLVTKTESGYTVRMTKPGDVPGSKAIYIKHVDNNGKTIRVYKETYDPQGKLLHSKTK